MEHTDSSSFKITDGKPYKKVGLTFTKCNIPKLRYPPPPSDEYICVETNRLKKAFYTFTRRPEKLDYPKHPEYVSYYDRLKTFKDWPKHFVKTPEELAGAGFFYYGYFDGVYDCVKCFFCDQGVCLWLEDDVCVKEHEKFNPSCPFIRSLLNRQ